MSRVYTHTERRKKGSHGPRPGLSQLRQSERYIFGILFFGRATRPPRGSFSHVACSMSKHTMRTPRSSNMPKKCHFRICERRGTRPGGGSGVDDEPDRSKGHVQIFHPPPPNHLVFFWGATYNREVRFRAFNCVLIKLGLCMTGSICTHFSSSSIFFPLPRYHSRTHPSLGVWGVAGRPLCS